MQIGGSGPRRVQILAYKGVDPPRLCIFQRYFWPLVSARVRMKHAGEIRLPLPEGRALAYHGRIKGEYQ